MKKNMVCLVILFVLIVFLQPFSMGQVVALKEVDIPGEHGRPTKVPSPGEGIIVPSDIKQGYASYLNQKRTWRKDSEQKDLYDKWVEQGELETPEHWSYIKVNGEERYFVALAYVFGMPGDFVDIYVTYEGVETVYPCIIGDSKSVYEDEKVYIYKDGTRYGHTQGEQTDICNIVEIFTPSDTINRPATDLLNRLAGVTKIANGGSIFDEPHIPVGLDGNVKYYEGSSESDNSGEGYISDKESLKLAGEMGALFRNIWSIFCVVFDNNMYNRDDVTVLYSLKNDEEGKERVVKLKNDFVEYFQDDYADIQYGDEDGTIATCGSAPTCFAMVASTLNGHKIKPDEVVKWSGNTYYHKGGTDESFFEAAKKKFNVKGNLKQVGSDEIDSVEAALKSGALVISSQGPGIFTSTGHYIVLAGTDNNGNIIVRDPNKYNAVNKQYHDKLFTKEQINEAANQYWIFYIN